MSEPTKSKFFTYEDGDGHVYVVDSLEQIPSKYRELAKEVRLGDRLKQVRALPKKGREAAKKVQREVGFVGDLDPPSVAVGFAASLVVILVLSIVKKTLGLMLKLALLALIFCLIGGAYFGWLRRAAGTAEEKLSSPKAVLDDAKRAATQFQKRIDDQEKALKKIEESAR
jgi:hypothetical protein